MEPESSAASAGHKRFAAGKGIFESFRTAHASGDGNVEAPVSNAVAVPAQATKNVVAVVEEINKYVAEEYQVYSADEHRVPFGLRRHACFGSKLAAAALG